VCSKMSRFTRCMYALKLRCLQVYIYSIYEVHIEYASANRPYVFKLPTGDTVYNIRSLFGGVY